jgi:hypothetical protein
MRCSSRSSLLAIAFFLTSATSAVRAQTAADDMPTQHAPMLMGAGQFTLTPTVSSLKAVPFSASFQSESKQILADGSTISNTRSGKVARDSAGRTYHETTVLVHGPAADPRTFTSINIMDSVDHVQFLLNPENHTARRIDLLSRAEALEQAKLRAAARTSATGGTADSATTSATPADTVATMNTLSSGSAGVMTSSVAAGPASRTLRPVAAGSRMPIQKEDLGTDSIDSVPVRHYRETQTIPAGEMGNDRDLVITSEFWYSGTLRLNLKATRNDPRYGEETLTLTEIETGEPSASLFEVPADYTITDAATMGVGPTPALAPVQRP